MRDEDFVYYRRRAAEEQTAADRASSLAAARAHKVIADRYAALSMSRPDLRPVEQVVANEA